MRSKTSRPSLASNCADPPPAPIRPAVEPSPSFLGYRIFTDRLRPSLRRRRLYRASPQTLGNAIHGRHHRRPTASGRLRQRPVERELEPGFPFSRAQRGDGFRYTDPACFQSGLGRRTFGRPRCVSRAVQPRKSSPRVIFFLDRGWPLIQPSDGTRRIGVGVAPSSPPAPRRMRAAADEHSCSPPRRCRAAVALGLGCELPMSIAVHPLVDTVPPSLPTSDASCR